MNKFLDMHVFHKCFLVILQDIYAFWDPSSCGYGGGSVSNGVPSNMCVMQRKIAEGRERGIEIKNFSQIFDEIYYA